MENNVVQIRAVEIRLVHQGGLVVHIKIQVLTHLQKKPNTKNRF